ncbi:MAG: hypothetical protein QOF33_4355 [Thermomicrobiales bacterium]|nr:hypothetical protein [Thermomicrobiales bacterium]
MAQTLARLGMASTRCLRSPPHRTRRAIGRRFRPEQLPRRPVGEGIPPYWAAPARSSAFVECVPPSRSPRAFKNDPNLNRAARITVRGVVWSHVHPQHIGPALPHQGGHGRGQPPVCRCSRSAVTWVTSHVLNMLATVAVAPSSVIRGRATSTDLGISGGVCATKRLSTNTEALGPRSVQALQIP